MSTPTQTPNESNHLLPRVEALLTELLRDLILEGAKTGDWEDVRGTSDALMALGKCLPSDRYLGLRRSASDFLIRKRILAQDGAAFNWEEEVWDTSVAILGLCDGTNDQTTATPGAVAWLAAKYQPQWNWNSEPWESLWALLAVRRVHQATDQQFNPDLSPIFEWLLKLCDTPVPGMLINWHYTALFVIVVRQYRDSSAAMIPVELLNRLILQHNKMVKLLRTQINATKKDHELWTSELWSNSLALSALAGSVETPLEPTEVVPILAWFGGIFKKVEWPTEDRAFACIALFQLHVHLAGLRYTYGPEHSASQEWVCCHCAENLQEKLAKHLENIRDYRKSPPFITSNEFDGYFSVHLNRKVFLLLVTIIVTIALTGLSINSHRIPEKYRVIATVLPILIGMFATVLQIFDIRVRDLLKRASSAETGD